MTDRLRRLGLAATLGSGLALVGGAAYGIASLNSPLADAAQQQRLQQIRQQSAPAAKGTPAADRPCPHRFHQRRAPSRDASRPAGVTL